ATPRPARGGRFVRLTPQVMLVPPALALGAAFGPGPSILPMFRGFDSKAGGLDVPIVGSGPKDRRPPLLGTWGNCSHSRSRRRGDREGGCPLLGFPACSEVCF